MANEKTNLGMELMNALGEGIKAQAMRPLKTTTTTMPVNSSEYETARNALDEAMARRNTIGYAIANSLASAPAQQGYGSWLGNFGRAFGGAYANAIDAPIERAEKNVALAKELMGQEQQVGYSPVDAGATGGAPAASGSSIGRFLTIPVDRKRGSNLHKLNVSAGKFDTNAYDPSDKNQGFLARQNIAMMPGIDYGLASAGGGWDKLAQKRAKDFQLFETSGIQSAFDVLKALRPATDTDVLIAMRAVGADPTLYSDVRDQRLTSEINKQLLLAGYPTIKNLEEWDSFVNKLYGIVPEEVMTPSADMLKKQNLLPSYVPESVRGSNNMNNNDYWANKYGAKVE